MFLAAKIFKPVFLSFNDVFNNITNDLALLDTNNIELGIEFNLALNENKISTQDLINIKDRLKKYVHCLLKGTIDRFPTNLNHFKDLKVYSPSVCLSQTLRVQFAFLPFTNVFIDTEKISMYNWQQYFDLNQLGWVVWQSNFTKFINFLDNSFLS